MTVITACVLNEVAHLTISGRVIHGLGTAAAMQRAIYRCAASHFRLLVIDLRRVEALDASGLSALVVAYLAAESVGASFRLGGVAPRLLELLKITRLDTILCKPMVGIERAFYE
jgi:anti-anti-sigma factor